MQLGITPDQCIDPFASLGKLQPVTYNRKSVKINPETGMIISDEDSQNQIHISWDSTTKQYTVNNIDKRKRHEFKFPADLFDSTTGKLKVVSTARQTHIPDGPGVYYNYELSVDTGPYNLVYGNRVQPLVYDNDLVYGEDDALERYPKMVYPDQALKIIPEHNKREEQEYEDELSGPDMSGANTAVLSVFGGDTSSQSISVLVIVVLLLTLCCLIDSIDIGTSVLFGVIAVSLYLIANGKKI